MLVKIRTRDNLLDLMKARESHAWRINKSRLDDITEVEIYNFEGTHKIKAMFDKERSRENEYGRVIVAFTEPEIVEADYKWVGQNPIKYESGDTIDETDSGDERSAIIDSIIKYIKVRMKNIIGANHGNFIEGDFHIRYGNWFEKFYLDWMDGSYESSIWLLVHKIMWEENLYHKFLDDKRIKNMEQVIEEYPDGLPNYNEEYEDTCAFTEQDEEDFRKILNEVVYYVGSILKKNYPYFESEAFNDSFDGFESIYEEEEVSNQNPPYFYLLKKFHDLYEVQEEELYSECARIMIETGSALADSDLNLDSYYCILNEGSKKISLKIDISDGNVDDYTSKNLATILEENYSNTEELDKTNENFSFGFFARESDVDDLWECKFNGLALKLDAQIEIMGIKSEYDNYASQMWVEGGDYDEGFLSRDDKDDYLGLEDIRETELDFDLNNYQVDTIKK